MDKPSARRPPHHAGGRSIVLGALRGKVVLVNFGRLLPRLHQSEMPGMVETYNQYKDRGFEIVAVGAALRSAPSKWPISCGRGSCRFRSRSTSMANMRAPLAMCSSPHQLHHRQDGRILVQKLGELDFIKLKAGCWTGSCLDQAFSRLHCCWRWAPAALPCRANKPTPVGRPRRRCPTTPSSVRPTSNSVPTAALSAAIGQRLRIRRRAPANAPNKFFLAFHSWRNTFTPQPCRQDRAAQAADPSRTFASFFPGARCGLLGRTAPASPR